MIVVSFWRGETSDMMKDNSRLCESVLSSLNDTRIEGGNQMWDGSLSRHFQSITIVFLRGMSPWLEVPPVDVSNSSRGKLGC